MIQSALTLILLGGALPAQDEDVYKDLKVGDRVQITFRNGNTITGNLVELPPTPGIDAAPVERPASSPFLLLFFQSKDEPASQTQDMILRRWMERHPEGKVETPVREESKPDPWEIHGIKSAPSAVFLDRASGRSLKIEGLQTETDLSRELVRFRAVVVKQQVDYTRENALTLDLSWEYPGLNGTMTVLKDQIRGIRKLEALDPKTRERLEEEKKKLAEQLVRDNDDRRAAEEERDKRARDEADARQKEEEKRAGAKDEIARVGKDAENLKKALELYRQFPPPEWGSKRYKEISEKSTRKLPTTLDEREFLSNYETWLLAQKYYEEKEKGGKEEGEKPEEKAPPGTETPSSPQEQPPQGVNP